MLVAGAAIALPVHALPGRYLGWIVMVTPLAASPERPAVGGFAATVLDVGHGLAVVIQTHGHALLYDAGARYRSGFDTGKEIVLPAIRYLGIEQLDRIVISHADNDHAGGLDAVLSRFPDADLVVGPDIDRNRATRCRLGQHWSWDGVEFDMLHPPVTFAARGNDSSCVLRVATSNGVLLLAGDLEVRGEQTLLASARNLSSDLVVVPHHGSATSSSAVFVERVRPRYAVVSARFANQWGFPKPKVRDRWEGAGTRMLVTGDAGAVAITFPPQGEPVLRSERGRWPVPWRFSPGS
jgi:competence protein ComEC